MKTTQPDYYEILGVPRNATQEQIKQRYRELAREYHPDRHSGNPLAGLAEERFKMIVAAWEVLSDPVKRRQYDESNDNSSEPDMHPYEATLSRISELCDQRLWKQGLTMCQSAVKEFGNRHEIHFLEGYIHGNLGEYHRAAQLFEWCIQYGPPDAGVQNYYGLTMLSLSRYTDAEHAFRRAISIDGEVPVFIGNLAIALESGGKKSEANVYWQRLQQIDPTNDMLASRQQIRQQQTTEQCAGMAIFCGLLECIFDCL